MEGKVSKIPRVTRNVGVQVARVAQSSLAPVPPNRPTPSHSEEEIVLIDDEDEEKLRENATGKSFQQVTSNVLPRGNGRRSLPTGGEDRAKASGDHGGTAAALSKSLLSTHNNRQQLGSSSNYRRNTSPSGSLHSSLSSGSLSITRTPKSPTISPAARKDEEPVTLTVKKVDQGGGGIMVQWAWNKASNFDISKVVSYQLEGSQAKSIWTKVGDQIKPLPLPMACTLNGFNTGITYRFRIKIQTRVNA